MREKHKSGIRHFAKLPAAAALFGAVAGGVQAADAVLAPVEVSAENPQSRNGTVNTFKAPTVHVGRVEQDARDLPQSVTSVTRQLMNDQDANTLKEALRNAVGVTFNAAEGGASGDGIRIRGFGASNDMYLDNFRDSAQYNRDTFHIDTVEVLRGPASMMFGRGSTGGVVNQVSKTPFRGDLTQLSTTIGMDSFYRVEGDFNKAIGESTAARINVMGQKADSFREGAEMNRWGIAPSITWGLGEPTQITASYLHYQEDNVPDYGVPYYRRGPGSRTTTGPNGKPVITPVTNESIHGSNQPIDRVDTFYGLKDFDTEETQTDVFTLRVEHQINPNMKIKNSTRAGKYDLDLRASAPGLSFAKPTDVLADSTKVTRGRKLRMREQEIYSNVTDLLWDFETGTIRHNVLAGFELTRENLFSTGRLQLDQSGKEKPSATTGLAGCTLPSTTVGNPVTSGVPSNCSAPVNTVTADSTADTVAFYFQDMIDLNPHWKVLLGARYDHFKASTENQSFTKQKAADNVSRTDKVWSYRTGLIYQPDQNQSYYASYGTSFNPSAEAYSTDPKGALTDPEENANYEIGARWTLLDGDLALRTAIFRTEKTNERQTDIEPGVIKPYLMSGKRHTDGIELEAAGRLTDKWQVFAGLALMDPVIDQVANPARKYQEGNRPDNAPTYTGNLWSTYQIDGNWKVGGGMNAMGKRYTSLDNTVFLPSYVRWDAMVEWTQRDLSIQLNVLNLFDTEHFEGLYAGFAVPGTTRTARVTATYKF
ncbi:MULTISPECIES: TonB-dependent receptor [Deefgea]|uniref:TonB-dependent siderophore receptor n=1 Tax=Deefgea chitinilytica TaxID=570276 RepID=A0ABS2CD63_9NEIS|nr:MULTISPECIES: TonB-dependent siderophore receptor [Deefgea]MBM5571311.1 TonB-dependent siderophore receptor [Deefgea chitinilytica]MBM9888543.1 TonB-dependent siderophore receptor [Deefgea sp. CFH1-16]